MDRDTHGSVACEVQHIVDLFLDYSPRFCLARESSIRAPLERTAQLRAEFRVRCRSSPFVRHLRPPESAVDGKKTRLGNPAAHDARIELLQNSLTFTARNVCLAGFHNLQCRIH